MGVQGRMVLTEYALTEMTGHGQKVFQATVCILAAFAQVKKFHEQEIFEKEKSLTESLFLRLYFFLPVSIFSPSTDAIIAHSKYQGGFLGWQSLVSALLY
jgi:hypothetical protein